MKASDSKYTALGVSKPCRPARLLCSSISLRMVSCQEGGKWEEEEEKEWNEEEGDEKEGHVRVLDGDG